MLLQQHNCNADTDARYANTDGSISCRSMCVRIVATVALLWYRFCDFAAVVVATTDSAVTTDNVIITDNVITPHRVTDSVIHLLPLV